jgi:signal transduction histidine kinase
MVRAADPAPASQPSAPAPPKAAPQLPSQAAPVIQPGTAPLLHFTQAELLHEVPGPPRPVSETINEDDLHGIWEPVALPLILSKDAAQRAPGMRTVWVRVRLDALQGVRGATHFYLLRWIAVGQFALYGDGRLLYRSPGTPVWNLFTHPGILLPLSRGADGAPPKTLLMRLDRVPTQHAALSSFYVGESTRVVKMAERRDWLELQLPFMTSAAFVLVGIFALGVWLFRRRYPGHLVFFISVMSMVRRWHFQLGIERLPVPDVWFIWLTLNALLWQVIATHYLLRFLHGRDQPRVNVALLVAGVLISVVTLPAGLLPLPDLLVVRHAAQFMVVIISGLIAVNGLWNSWRARSFDAGLLAVAYTLSYLAGVSDYFALLNLQDAERMYLTPHATLLYAIACIFLLFRRYVSVMGEIETINARLEGRIAAREAELAESYARLREVEHNQTLSEERARLMQDMHDGLGSSLTSVLRVVESGQGSDEELKEALKSCIDDLKLTIDSMEPVEADLLLLLATLRYRLGPRLKSAGITLRWEVMDVPRLEWLDPRNSLHILRILQEAFGNILKHTQATEIRVATGADEQWVWVTITDNGAGFDVPEARRRGGRGLANQERRARELNARLRLESTPEGTRLALMLPRRLQQPDEASAWSAHGAPEPRPVAQTP